MLKFNKLFLGMLVLVWSVSGPAAAVEKPKRITRVAPGSFIELYGKAFVEYSRRVEEKGGRMSDAERQRLYDDLFSEAKQAYAKERAETQERLKKMSKIINAQMKAAKEGRLKQKVAKHAEPRDGKSTVASNGSGKGQSGKAPEPARSTASDSRTNTTGPVGEAAGADAVDFNGDTKSDGVNFAAPTADGAVKEGGAETLNFGVSEAVTGVAK